MSAVPAAIRAAAEPQVNLLPPEVAARRARGRRRGAMLAGLVGFVALAAGVVYLAGTKEAAAQDALDEAVAVGADLQRQIDAFQPLLDIQAEVLTTASARTYVGSTEVLLADLMRQIQWSLPSGTLLDSVTWNGSTILSVTDPTVINMDMGWIGMTGEIPTFVTAAELEEALNGVPGLSGASVSILTIGGEPGATYYSFDASARITALALSGRFGSAWLVTDARDRASAFLHARVTAAQAAYEAALDADAGYPTAAVLEAEGLRDAADDDWQILKDLRAALDEAEVAIVEAEEAIANGLEGFDDDLATATASRDAIQPLVDDIVAAVLVWGEAVDALADVESRIAAAQAILDTASDAVLVAEEQVAAGEEGADAALRTAERDQETAALLLETEESFLEGAEAAVAALRIAVDEAMAAAEAEGVTS